LQRDWSPTNSTCLTFRVKVSTMGVFRRCPFCGRMSRTGRAPSSPFR
jgi:hypothetical protein